MSKAGRFAISVSQGSWPIFCTLMIDSGYSIQFYADDLPDLQYAVERARIEAQAQTTNPNDKLKL